MNESTAPPGIDPGRDDVVPESYAIYVTEEYIHVWQYRVTLSEPDGDWSFVETLAREDGPRLSVEYATPMAPGADGYWIYSREYDCTLDC